MSKNTNIYVNIGGQGATNSTAHSSIGANGGYNGGETSYPNAGVNHLYGSGGGATHISLASGLISSLNNSIDKILIVAGGGGGFYGGNAGSTGGGSGYIGNSFTNISQNPVRKYAKQGNGYAKITYLED